MFKYVQMSMETMDDKFKNTFCDTESDYVTAEDILLAIQDNKCNVEDLPKEVEVAVNKELGKWEGSEGDGNIRKDIESFKRFRWFKNTFSDAVSKYMNAPKIWGLRKYGHLQFNDLPKEVQEDYRRFEEMLERNGDMPEDYSKRKKYKNTFIKNSDREYVDFSAISAAIMRGDCKFRDIPKEAQIEVRQYSKRFEVLRKIIEKEDALRETHKITI